MNRDQKASIFLFGVGILMALLSLRYGHGTFGSPRAGFMPFWAGMAVCLFSVIGFCVNWKKQGDGKEKFLLGPLWFKPLVVFITMVGYALFLDYLGFLICTFIYMLILLQIIEPHKWKVVLGVALGTVIISYVVFNVFLKTQLPMGILGGYLLF